MEIFISDERSELLDTGGAIVHASSYLNNTEPFLVMAVDILTDLDLNGLIQYHYKNKPLVTLGVKDRQTSRSLLFNEEMHLCGWRNNTTGEVKGSNLQNVSHALGFSVIQLIQPEIFNLIEEEGAFSLINLYLRLMNDHKIIGFRQDNSIWFEFGRMDRINEYSESAEFHQLTASL